MLPQELGNALFLVGVCSDLCVMTPRDGPESKQPYTCTVFTSTLPCVVTLDNILKDSGLESLKHSRACTGLVKSERYHNYGKARDQVWISFYGSKRATGDQKWSLESEYPLDRPQ